MPFSKCFISLSGFGGSVFLVVHFVLLSALFRHCYRLFQVFCRHPIREWWPTCIILYYPTFVILHTIGPVYTELASVEATRGCFVRFFWRLRFSPYLLVRYKYNHPKESFRLLPAAYLPTIG